MQQRILVADNDSLSREFLVEALRTLDYRVGAAENGAQANERLASNEYHLVLVTTTTAGMDDLRFAQSVIHRYPAIPVVLVTAPGGVEEAVEAMKSGIADFILKPVSPDYLQAVVERVFRQQRLKRENAYLREQGAWPIEENPNSSAMSTLLGHAKRMSSSDGTVLLSGEPGTGKMTLAHLIHRKSPRRDGPFIIVDCAVMTEQVLRRTSSSASAARSLTACTTCA